MTTETFKVIGMSCSHCQSAVKQALEAVPGVESADVDLQAGEAKVTYDPARATKDALKAAVEEAGYELAV
ncbi:MAG: heavy-metal-associated domain-containing protein [Clostridia bacterium]|nr:heavy-metal-associated domain-containing protein [Clostridia bacterium]